MALKTAVKHEREIKGIQIGMREVKLKDTCTPRFTTAQFAIAETWKPPKCQMSINRGKDKDSIVHICIEI